MAFLAGAVFLIAFTTASFTWRILMGIIIQ